MTGWGERRWYYIIFLLQEKTKRIFVDVSFSKDLKKVLRKHWQGHNPETAEIFSMENADAIPKMHVWEAGEMPRPKALVYLEKWKTVFAEAGYDVYGSAKAKWPGKPYNVFTSEDRRALSKISVELFKQGKEFQVICCEDAGENKKVAHQKYCAVVSDETLSIRTNGEIASEFRDYCWKNDLTHSQGLMQLLEGKAEEQGMLEKDLQARLHKADRIIEDQKETISRLRSQLKQARSNPEESKKLERAKLQNLLLEEFFKRLPAVDHTSSVQIKRRNRRQIAAMIGDLSQYCLPAKSEIIQLRIEEVGYGKRSKTPLFVYGKTVDGKPLKLRCYGDKTENFGESLWESRFLVEDSEWLFAVQKMGDTSNVVGALPVIDEKVLAVCMGAIVEAEGPEETKEYDVEDYLREADELARMYDLNDDDTEFQYQDEDDMLAYSGLQKLDDLINYADKRKSN